MYSLKLTLDGLPKTTNSTRRQHWRALHTQAKLWQTKTIVAIGRLKPLIPLKHAQLTLTRYSSKEPDFDGLVSSFKHIVDSLILAQILVDDKPSVIGQPNYRWYFSHPKRGYVTVEVTELPAASTQPNSPPPPEPKLTPNQKTPPSMPR